MNRPVHYLEDRSPNQSLPLQALVERLLVKINEDPKRINPKNWVVYCNDRRVDSWKKNIRAKSRLVLAARYAPQLNLKFAFENNSILVADKEPGLPTQPTLKSNEDNLFFQVKFHFIQQKGFPVGLPYVGLHHRLDRGTSGLVLMTKQRQANKEVSDLFKNRNIEKEYQAFAQWGVEPMPDSWTHKGAIQRKTTSKKNKFAFQVDPKGDPAWTEFKVIEAKEGEYYRLACFPKTGRTHQIRVHLADRGYPVLGDPVYGVREKGQRLMLHAYRIRFQLAGDTFDIKSRLELEI